MLQKIVTPHSLNANVTKHKMPGEHFKHLPAEGIKSPPRGYAQANELGRRAGNTEDRVGNMGKVSALWVKMSATQTKGSAWKSRFRKHAEV